MLKLLLKDIFEILEPIIIHNNLNLIDEFVINSICLDTRKLDNNLDYNSVFIAIAGDNFDGHDYLSQAQEKGAVLAVVEKFNKELTIPQLLVSSTKKSLYYLAKFLNMSWGKPTVCITGSNGKTSTKFILKNILEQKNSQVLCSIASYNNDIGVPLTMFDATDLQWAGIFEMGTNHPGEIAYLTEMVQTDVAIITTISATHIGNFNSVDDIADEKSCIFNNLKPNGTAVLNFDNKYKSYIINKFSSRFKELNINILSFGTNQQADVWASNIDIQGSHTLFDLHYKNQVAHIKLRLLGQHQVDNCLAAAAAAIALGVDLELIKVGLENVQPVDKRMQPIVLNNNVALIDDSYNASPDSVEAAIKFLASLKDDTKILVLGDLAELGALDHSEHRKIGELAKFYGIDYLFTNGELTKNSTEVFYNNNLVSQYQFDNKQELSNTIIEHIKSLQNNCVILIKGSNSAKMWEVTDNLVAEFK